MIKLLTYIVIVVAVIVLIVLAVRLTSKVKKAFCIMGAVLLTLLFIFMATCYPVLIPSAIKKELSNVEEIKIPSAITDAVDSQETIELYGSQVKVSDVIITGSEKDITNHIRIVAYRFMDGVPDKKLIAKFMTDVELRSVGKVKSFFYGPSEGYEYTGGFYNYGTPEQIGYYLGYAKDVSDNWIKEIRKIGDTTVYSTLTAITVTDHDETIAMVGRFVGDSYLTVYAVQQGDYLYVISEKNFCSSNSETSYFSDWLNEAQDWEINESGFLKPKGTGNLLD